jgi:hypothetical protein
MFAAVATVCFVAPALAQTDAPLPPAAEAATLPPVDTMSCEQMNAEMMVAGQQMNSQLDPSFAGNVQAYQDLVQQRQREAVAQQVGMGAACAVGSMVPGVAAACAAAQQAQMANQVRQAQQDQQQVDVIVGQVNSSMDGLDQNRLTAIADRHQAMNCQTPQ